MLLDTLYISNSYADSCSTKFMFQNLKQGDYLPQKKVETLTNNSELKENGFGYNPETLSVITNLVNMVVVVITLFYVSKQLKILVQQNILSPFQNTYNELNQFNDTISQSLQVSEVVFKGRKSLTSLSESERIQFEHLHCRLLNTLEGWIILSQETIENAENINAQIESIRKIVKYYYTFPGTIDFWEKYKELYSVELGQIMDEQILIHLTHLEQIEKEKSIK